MPGKNSVLVLLIVCVGLSPAGCPPSETSLEDDLQIEIPPHIVGTVREHVMLVGGGRMPVTGWGLVVGLGSNGSKVVPAHVRSYLVEQLSKANIGSTRHGTGTLSPERVLQDPDTTAVMLAGSIPFGAQRGTRFDVNVSALPQTGTRSLDGGHLMPTELRFAYGWVAVPGKGAKVFAMAKGRMFLDPYVNMSDSADAGKLREAWILGGGVVTRDRPIRLQLRDPDYQMVQRVRDRINERFGAGEKIANARNREMIELDVPPAWRKDYEHFLQLVMHLPLQSEPGQRERKINQLMRMLATGGAKHEELSLILEAMGREVEVKLRRLYSSRNRTAAFYAARTGLRLGDDLAGEILIRQAADAGSPMRIAAIDELARHPRILAATDMLQTMLDDRSAAVRVAAYEALRQRSDAARITRISVGREFDIDLVDSKTDAVIYATQSLEPRIVIFGRGVSVARPIYFSTPDELVTLNARDGQKKLTVYRKIQRTGKSSDPFEVDFKVQSLISTLGNRPVRGSGGKIKGLGLSYGQVVQVLRQMCDAHHIRARFVLQRPGVRQRIRRGAVGAGRPDLPGE